MTLPLQVIGKPSIRASQITTDQIGVQYFGENASESVQWLAPIFKCAELRTLATGGTDRWAVRDEPGRRAQIHLIVVTVEKPKGP